MRHLPQSGCATVLLHVGVEMCSAVYSGFLSVYFPAMPSGNTGLIG